MKNATYFKVEPYDIVGKCYLVLSTGYVEWEIV